MNRKAPRIDPLQLLTCLSVLLKLDGGIRSRDEVPRLVSLMTKFSKKLVSKCIYSLILKNTETSLVDMFMAEGGWSLVETWIQDGIQTSNWHLMEEILDLLLITPVDVDRLKLNCLPKIIKSLSRREDLHKVAQLSSQIVQNWLYVVKGISNVPKYVPIREGNSLDCGLLCESEDSLGESTVAPLASTVDLNLTSTDNFCGDIDPSNNELSDNFIKPAPFYKLAVKGGKQVFRKVPFEEQKLVNDSSSDEKLDLKKDSKSDEKNREKHSRSTKLHSRKDKERDRNNKHSSNHSRSKSSSSSKSTKDKHRDKHRDKHNSSGSNSLSNKHSSSSGGSSHSNSSSSRRGSHSSSKDRDRKKESKSKENQQDKDKNTLEKLKPQALDKLGRIPKKSNSPTLDEKPKESQPDNVENVQKKKPSFSILNKKASGEERVKTVKIYNSKMRSTGLEEEVKPPPPRSAKRTTVQLPPISPKRPSTEPSTANVSEKKLKFDKVDIPERPGAIKLIAPKPKPAVLQESDMFMDALKASAPKKETRKRKRVSSISKENQQNATPTTPENPQSCKTTVGSPALGLKNIAPINFYQDTLTDNMEMAESKTESPEPNTEDSSNQSCDDTPASPATPIKSEGNGDDDEDDECPIQPKKAMTDELKGVLLYTKKKGPKKSIKWKEEEELVEIRFFELDETERVNVTKNFMDMAKMELNSEREALMMSRKVNSEDVMEPQISWHKPCVCDQPEILAAPGSKSTERDVQFAREKASLPTLYFDKRKIPDSPEEPPVTTSQISDPTVIPLDDPEGQEVDLRSTPWPEPKGQQPPPVEIPQIPPILQNVPFNSNFSNVPNIPPPPQFPMPPRYSAPPIHPLSNPPIGPGPTPQFPPTNMNIGIAMNPEMMNQPQMNPNMFAPPPNGFIVNRNEQNYPMPQFNNNQGPNMFMHNNFNNRGGNRGGFRGRGSGGNNAGGGGGGGWVRMSGPGSWKRGGGSRGGRLCKNIQNHGFCRNGDNCAFIHPS